MAGEWPKIGLGRRVRILAMHSAHGGWSLDCPQHISIGRVTGRSSHHVPLQRLDRDFTASRFSTGELLGGVGGVVGDLAVDGLKSGEMMFSMVKDCLLEFVIVDVGVMGELEIDV